MTAARFDAKFDAANRLHSVHAAPNAKIISSVPGQPDRASTSQTLDATFLPDGGIDRLTQDGNVTYKDEQRQAWGEHARYTPSDQVLRDGMKVRALP